MSGLAIWASVWSLAWGCARREVEAQDVCSEIAFSISNHTLFCTDDSEAANAAYEDFAARYACAIPEDADSSALSGGLECAVAVRQLSCDLTSAFGSDYDQWLQHADDRCAAAIVRQNGDPLAAKQELPDAQ